MINLELLYKQFNYYLTLLGNSSTIVQNIIGSVNEVNPSKTQHISSACRSLLVFRTNNANIAGTPQVITKKKYNYKFLIIKQIISWTYFSLNLLK